MRRHLNTLYVISQGSYLSKDGANVVVSVERVEKARVPIHTLGGIVGMGQVSMSPQLMGFCSESGVSVAFLTENGRFLARVEGAVAGNVLLRREQYRRTDDEVGCAALVRSIVIGKTLNQRAVLRRGLRDYRERLGVEQVQRLEQTVGLDPAVGFLHRDRPGRPSLALDLCEEFRPWFGDRLVLSLVNRRQLGAKDFHAAVNGAVIMKDEARKAVLIAYQERKKEELRHEFLGEAVTIGLMAHVQAQLLARHLRGDLDGYPPFIWR